ncbi:MAG: hypothetical protein ACRD4R_13300 [Candidatus Acidiferrales bacterium]
MPSRRQSENLVPARPIALTALLFITLLFSGLAPAQSSTKPNNSTGENAQPHSGKFVSPIPRGTKLMLKDGSYELVSEYDIQGDRVRYYSIDRLQWEVIPTSIVDWDATRKREAQEEKSQASLLKKAEKQEDERRAVPTLDIDASLVVAPGIFLPPGDGLFVFDGKSVLQVPQAETDSHVSKTHFLERVLVPVPIIPSRNVISIPGKHAKLRLNSRQPEFYLRTGDPREPDVMLIRAKVQHGDRHIMNLDTLMGNQHTSSDALPLQRWVIAKGVYRFTMGRKLSRGEYVIAEILPNQGMSLYVWDFGVN